MAYRKVKDAPKIFETDPEKIKSLVLRAMGRISHAVGCTLGPSGKNALIESDFPGIPAKNTKDGVSVFRSLGAKDAYEHLIIEQARDCAQRTAAEAGDGTTTATILAHSLIQHIFDFCERNPKYSPQKAVRQLTKYVNSTLIPYINERSIKIDDSNKEMLKMVAKVSANGDEDMANAVIEAFEEIGYGEASHVTIKQMSGQPGYKVERIDGFPIPIGYEDSIGKLQTVFINDQANQRVFLEKPLIILYDGQLNDLAALLPCLDELTRKFTQEANSDYKNLVIFAHGFSEAVLNQLAFVWAEPLQLNVLPLTTPMAQFSNSQLHFLNDMAAFTGATVYGLQNQLSTITMEGIGKGMDYIEVYRFRSTIVGDPNATNVEVRANDLKVLMGQAESQAEKVWIQERLGKITNGIAKLTIYGGSNGELKESHDRVEDAVCAVRAAITNGALPGGTRIAIDMVLKVANEFSQDNPVRQILAPALMSLPLKLLENAGYDKEERDDIIDKLIYNPTLVYDVENQVFGLPEELGLFDATKAVSESLINATSIASVLGTMGCIVAHPRDDQFEREEAHADQEFMKVTENATLYRNEANERP